MRSQAAIREIESEFGIHELFFSRTDPKGHIQSGNEVFARVSGHPRAEMLGKAHNMIRHPDMPRAVFKVLWEYLEAGRPIAAYVKNRSADGSYYWVIAVVFAVPGGYLSVRLKPSGELFSSARRIYGDLRRVEIEVEAGSPRNRKQAIAAGREALIAALESAGFESYDAFMHAALADEAACRQATLADLDRASTARLDRGGCDLERILAACDSTQDYLRILVVNIASYQELGSKLAQKSGFLLDLADSIRLFSLNAMLGANRLGADEGAALDAVAGIMRSRSDAITPVIQTLSQEIGGTIATLGELGFRIANAQLLAEMVTIFVRELIAADAPERRSVEDLEALAHSLAEGIELLFGGLVALDRHLATILRHVGLLSSSLETMRALEVNGRIEAARASDAKDVRSLFVTIGEQIRSARAQIDDLATVRQIAHGRDDGAERQVLVHVRTVSERVRALAVAA